MQPFRFDDVGAAFDRGFDRSNALMTNRAQRIAGGALTRGDYGGASNALLGAGMLEPGLAVQAIPQRQAEAQAAAQKTQRDEAAEWTLNTATRLRSLYDSAQGEPQEKAARVLAGLEQIAPQAAQYGVTPEDVQTLRQQIMADPEAALTMLGAGAAQQAGYEIRNAGEEVLVIDPRSGQLVSRFRGARTVNVPEGGALYELPGEGGARQVGGAPPQAMPQAGDMGDPDAIIAPLVAQGARVTSAARTPERNASVGGVPNSFHLESNGALARDLVPPPGVSMDAFAQQVRQTLPPGWKAINEGDHVHIEPNRRPPALAGGATMGGQTQAPGGPRLLVERPRAPKETYQTLTPQEVAAAGLQPGNYQRSPQGQITRIAGQTSERPIPGPVVSGYNANVTSLNKIRSAMAAVQEYPRAFGLQNMMGDAVQQRLDPEGVKARALVADIGSFKIHERSGAAVTAAEFPRLKPFVPLATDTPQTIMQKLQNFEAELAAVIEETEAYYSPESGYRPLQRRTVAGAQGGAQRGVSGMSDEELKAELGL